MQMGFEVGHVGANGRAVWRNKVERNPKSSGQPRFDAAAVAVGDSSTASAPFKFYQ